MEKNKLKLNIWNNDIKVAIKQNKLAHKQWKEAGKPCADFSTFFMFSFRFFFSNFSTIDFPGLNFTQEEWMFWTLWFSRFFPLCGRSLCW
jgi:hypothetical protein